MLVELSVVEQRYQAVLAVIRDGVPIVQVAHLQGPMMQIWDGEELLKTVLRANRKEVRKRHAAKAS
jgi:hypothetical protein